MPNPRQQAVLETLGVDIWVRRQRPDSEELSAPLDVRHDQPEPDVSADPTPPPVLDEPGYVAEDAGISIEASLPESPQKAAVQLGDVVRTPTPVLGATVESLEWPALKSAVSGCEACALHQGRTQTVFGVGDQKARLMIIGEAPGADEDRQGEPFVGRAGQLLNAMLAAIGFEREQVYIANIVKCRPPGNRDPHADEAAACKGYLLRQIELIDPALILSVGRVSAHNLLGTEEAVGRLRGRTHQFQPGDVPLIVTYHPAYLLRRPEEKAKSWQDLQAAYRVLQGES